MEGKLLWLAPLLGHTRNSREIFIREIFVCSNREILEMAITLTREVTMATKSAHEVMEENFNELLGFAEKVIESMDKTNQYETSKNVDQILVDVDSINGLIKIVNKINMDMPD